jgi:histidinol-phosphate aminotransferase
MKTKLPYNVNAAAYVAALESLTDLGHLRRKVKAINKERGRLFRKLEKTGYLQPFPSEANFILCRVLDGKAMDIYEGLQKDGIFIRYFDAPLLRNYLRISVGRPEHTDALMEALAKIANSGG